MKLRDLEAEFYHRGDGRHGMGVHFLCPHCRDITIFVPFENPIDGGPKETPSLYDRARWHRAGETIDTLTITPSIHTIDHWHGWIRNGEVVNA